MDNDSLNPISYKTIEEIRFRKALLLKDIQKDDLRLRNQWHSLFSKPAALKSNATPSRRINSLVNTGAGVLDAFILGWKLYRKFKK
ncbi:MAG: hypothetical protein I3J02_11510 [Prevotella sp.]|nr:hypothetical protein [Prevotella sp.]